jgi:beta-glucosidase
VRARTPAEMQAHDGGRYEEVAVIPGSDYTAMGWEIYPHGLSNILIRVNQDYAPPAIMITENGAAFNDVLQADNFVHDAERTSFLREHISSVAIALANGVPIKGYFAWSLMDNFEWSEGYSKRFGIVYNDYPTQQRTVKDSGRWYSSFLTTQSTT